MLYKLKQRQFKLHIRTIFVRIKILYTILAILRKAVDGNSSESTLAVFLNFASGCQFHVLNPVIKGQEITIDRVATVYSPEVITK